MRKNFFFLLCLLAVPSFASENLSTLIADARVLAQDASSPTRQRFSDSNITEYLNEAQSEALAANNCLMQSTQFQLTPGVTYYALPSNFLSIVRVTIGAANHQMMLEQSPRSLDGRSRGWESASGYPVYYFLDFSTPTSIGFTPWPAAAADTDTVKVEYDITANLLVNSTDLPFNGVTTLQDYHHALAYFAAAMMDQVNDMTQRSTFYMNTFVGMVKLMADRCRLRPNYSPSAAGTP